MTGKEALKEIRLVRVYIDEFGCEVPLKKVKEYKIIENELDELTKYKRAFEILKDRFKFELKINPSEYWLEYTDREYGSDHRCMDLNKEEAELLEELMKDE